LNNTNISYKDKNGFIFTHQKKIYRCILQPGKDDYELLMNSGLYEYLTSNELLIPHKEINDAEWFPHIAYKIIQPAYIPFITYPYEWGFATLQQAALLTLEINIKALEYGMILKDATPLNVQFYKGKLIFIDTLSFEKYDQDKPWIAYRQFCESFLLPLLLIKYYPSTHAGYWYGTADFVSINEYACILPFKSKFNLAALLHIHLQNNNATRNTARKERKIKKQQLLNLLHGLKNNIHKLTSTPSGKNWSSYYQKDHSEDYYVEKEKLVHTFLKTIPHQQTGLDIGCNTGNFSYILSDYCAHTIATDADSICIDLLQKKILADKKNIIPLIIDYCNPTPNAGLDTMERLSFFGRIEKAGIILFLALAHHIVLSKNVPLPLLSKSLSEKCDFLLIEFCTEEDEKVKEIISRKKYHHEWGIIYFEKYFTEYFIQLKKEQVGKTRTLYLFKNKLC
jgi:hypothetical protein